MTSWRSSSTGKKWRSQSLPKVQPAPVLAGTSLPPSLHAKLYHPPAVGLKETDQRGAVCAHQVEGEEVGNQVVGDCAAKGRDKPEVVSQESKSSVKLVREP